MLPNVKNLQIASSLGVHKKPKPVSESFVETSFWERFRPYSANFDAYTDIVKQRENGISTSEIELGLRIAALLTFETG